MSDSQQCYRSMYATCPKCQYQRRLTDTAPADVCPACGVVFSKWVKRQFTAPESAHAAESESSITNRLRRLADYLFYVEPKIDPVFFYGRAVLYAGLLVWGWSFIMMDFKIDPSAIGNSWMHNINLVFHEAGHVLFRPFGWFITILGGTLGQLLMPVVVMFTFLIKNRNNFGASVGLWWLGQSFMDTAPYIDDALVQKMVLLGGHTGADMPGNHDWNNILGDLNRLEKCRDYATIADVTGTVLMIIAFLWGGYILYRQYQMRR